MDKKSDEKLLEYYFKIVSRYPVMDRDREIKAFRILSKLKNLYKTATSDKRRADIEKRIKKVKDYIVLRNLRLAVTIAKQMFSSDASLIDIINEANLGLIEAVDRFDPERGTHFSTYASWWIKQAIYRALNEDFRALKIPPGKLPLMRQFYRVSARLFREKGEYPTFSEVAKEMDLPSGEMIKLMSAIQKPVYLSSQISSEDDREYGDVIQDEYTVSPIEYVMAQDLKNLVSSVLNILPERDRKVIEMRFGLGNYNRTHTLREVAEVLGISRERVRQIQNRAIEKIKNYRITLDLEDFLEDL